MFNGNLVSILNNIIYFKEILHLFQGKMDLPALMVAIAKVRSATNVHSHSNVDHQSALNVRRSKIVAAAYAKRENARTKKVSHLNVDIFTAQITK